MQNNKGNKYNSTTEKPFMTNENNKDFIINLFEKELLVSYWELYPRQHLIWGSEHAFLLLGLKRPENGKIAIEKLKEICHTEDRNKLEASFIQLAKKHQNFDIVFRIQRETQSGTRETRYIRAKSITLEQSEGKIKYIGVIQDVSEQKKTERELLRARDKAEESDKMKTAFLANMSHEIRTPMNTIIGFSELLNIDTITPKQKREYSEIIKNKGNLLLTLIDDIIEISKFESGKLNITRTQTNLHAILNELYIGLKEQKSRMGKDNLEIFLIKPDEGPNHVYTDPGRLQQVLDNLLSNALKFTEKGTITFGYKPAEDNTITFFVKDTGIGLSKEQHRVIFNRFKQLEETQTRQYGGSGLGLTISKGIIELLGGKIWVESELQKGASFYFTLPFEEGDETDIQPQDKTEFDISNYNWKNKVILIAEDEDVNFKFIETLLNETQAQVLHAENGLQVIDLIKSINKIDLILMDIKMPVMNGYEATREVKKINPNIPVIAQTAFSMQNDKQKCIDAGCDDYVAKPIEIESLIQTIDKYLSQ